MSHGNHLFKFPQVGGGEVVVALGPDGMPIVTRMSALADSHPLLQWVELRVKMPVAMWLFQHRVRPNQITLAGLAICISAAMLLYATHSTFLAGIVFAFGCLGDLFDGAVARLTKNHNFGMGKLLDIYSDKLSEWSMLVGIGRSYPGETAVLAILAIASSLVVTTAKTGAEEAGIYVKWNEVYIFGHPGRVAIMIAGMLIASFADSQVSALNVMLIVLNVSNVLIAIQRIMKVILAWWNG